MRYYREIASARRFLKFRYGRAQGRRLPLGLLESRARMSTRDWTQSLDNCRRIDVQRTDDRA